ncbi:biorientation of chromosomes in cell division protein 1-like 1 [Megalops cyprinoides]|uniref:biorientation of chromosomes in cell division protein 1-like 1 n=1 Tax=Megalops cyprinoides TaxID=118141 RepID=UPI001863F038|nr:biorientation of chromosomes in cell division protein 1-like 1 [Megalops cyprinoides]
MAGLPPGDPQLVSMIVNHLKTQGLFDQFRRDCLADVDTKPAYLNLRQRVDNFVSNHLSNHTWSPHLNKNQLRNNIRQLVLQSGMLEQGVDRIVAQVVDPKIHHTFRPQVERVVREFLSPGTPSDQPVVCPTPGEERQDSYIPAPGPSSIPAATAASDAMSILDTISSLNQEASTRGGGDRAGERSRKAGPTAAGDGGLERDPSQEELAQEMEAGEQDMSLGEEAEEKGEGWSEEQPGSEAQAREVEMEVTPEASDPEKQGTEGEEESKEPAEEAREVKAEEGRDRASGKPAGKAREDGEAQKSPSEKQHIRQKARESLKEEYSLEDSDLDGLSDITVSSVHTSDLSSFEEESDEDPQPSDSTEEGEITSEDEKIEKKPQAASKEESKERKPRGGRQAYVHKPFLYSRYYSDSDDEITVEQRRRSAAKEKEERLLKRQQNRERLEEKRRQKVPQSQETEEGGSEPASPNPEPQGPSAKEARKQKKVLEKQVALSRKRKRDSRKEDETEASRGGYPKSQQPKPVRRASESATSEEGRRRKSGSVSEETPAGGAGEQRKPLVDRSRTHSFILDLELGSEGLLRQRAGGKFDRHPKHPRERGEKEHSLSDERSKHRPRAEDDRADKRSRSKADRKSSSTSREVRTSLSEAGTPEEGAKRPRGASVDSPKTEKAKGEKGAQRSDPRQPFLLDSAGSSEDRSDMEPGGEGGKRKDRLPKDMLKRSKSHSEERHPDRPKAKPESRDAASATPTTPTTPADRRPRADPGDRAGSDSDADRTPRDAEPGSKVKAAVADKSRSRSREDPKAQAAPRVERKGSAPEAKGKAPKPSGRPDSSKEKRRESTCKEDRRREGREEEKSRKEPERKSKEAEKKGEETLGDRRRGSRGDSSLSPPILSTPEPAPTVVPVPEDNNMDAQAAPTASAIGVSYDTFDALSDITPEPEDDELVFGEGTLIVEDEDETASWPASTEADTTVSCAAEPGPSLDGRFSQGGSEVTDAGERAWAVGVTGEGDSSVRPPGGDFRMMRTQSEISMREAALTLLSMDPDTTTSQDVIMEMTSPAPRHLESPLTHRHGEDAGDPSDRTTAALTATEPWSVPASLETDTPVHGVSDTVMEETHIPEVTSREVTSQEEAEKDSGKKGAGRRGRSQRSTASDESEAAPSQGEGAAGTMEDKTVISTEMEETLPGGVSTETDESRPIAVSAKTEESQPTVLSIETEESQPMVLSIETEESQPMVLSIETEESQPIAVSSETDATHPAAVSAEADETLTTVVSTETAEAHPAGSVLQPSSEESPSAEAKDEASAVTEEAERQTESMERSDGGAVRTERSAEMLPAECRPHTEGEKGSGPAKADERGTDLQQKEEKEEEEVPAERKGGRPKTATKETGKRPAQEKEESESEEQSDQAEEIRPTRRGRPPRIIKQASRGSKSDTDSQERSPERSAEDKETEDVKETRGRRGRASQSASTPQKGSTPQRDTSKTRKEESEETAAPGGAQKAKSDDEGEKAVEPKTPRRGRPPKTTAPSLRGTRSSSQEQEEEKEGEGKDTEERERAEDAPARRGRSSGTAAKTTDEGGQQKEEAAREGTSEEQREKEEEEKSDQKRGGRRGRPAKAPLTVSTRPEEALEQREAKVDGENSEPKETTDAGKRAVKRKRSEEREDSAEEGQLEGAEPKEEGAKRQTVRIPREDSTSQSDGQEDVKEDSSNDNKTDNDEDKEQPQKKKATRRGRPSKTAVASAEDSEKKDQKATETEEEQEAEEDTGEEEEETQTRATTRSATRLEAERNKPSKPSTRALSKLRGKEETTPTRGGRGQALKAGRKRETSPPTPRTRGGQKAEEPPAKRKR